MGFDTDIMPGLEVLEVEHPPSCISTVERRAAEVHRKATFLRGITDNNRGIHSRCFRDTLAVCNRVSISRVRVIVVIIISTTISTISIASSTSSYGAVGVLIIVIITAACAMRARCASASSLLGLGFIKRFRFLFRIYTRGNTNTPVLQYNTSKKNCNI